MKKLLSTLYPEMMVVNPPVQFVGGRAEVSDEVARVLVARTVLGIVVEGEAPTEVPVDDESVAITVVPADPDDSPKVVDWNVILPSKRASVPEWVQFMAEHGIAHDEGATRAEMRAIAEQHFSG